jgi:hypothetical protein
MRRSWIQSLGLYCRRLALTATMSRFSYLPCTAIALFSHSYSHAHAHHHHRSHHV